jgi:hypothetical protein
MSVIALAAASRPCTLAGKRQTSWLVKGRIVRQSHRSVSNSDGPAQTATEKHAAFMKDANAKMQTYHEARELLRQGKLPSANAHRGPKNASAAQGAVAVVFVMAFFAMPFLGKKIATDDEFRKTWMPAWYDFTVKKPERAWTRQELHEQMLAVQRDVRERAIAGEFTPQKLQEMQSAMQQSSYQPHREGINRSKIPKEWDKIHPGLDDDEKLDESGS